MPRTKAIPDGWSNYTGLGKRIPGTPFIPSKTPLSHRLCNLLPSGTDHYTPEMLISDTRKLGYDLKMVIDLTATNRYYDPNVFAEYNIEYVKLMVSGGSVPHAELFLQFKNAVDSFMERWNYTPRSEEVIAVHCTHGVNRTGFFICKYLIHELGLNPEETIRQFEEYRGYPIERKHLIDNLLCRNPGDLLSARFNWLDLVSGNRI
uniref:TYR_PHOSPHATASE_2 domain-containing protein n=1 Tax=Trichuris muris TaxID=70415 RepID=A0A5S6QL40_TRIMR